MRTPIGTPDWPVILLSSRRRKALNLRSDRLGATAKGLSSTCRGLNVGRAVRHHTTFFKHLFKHLFLYAPSLRLWICHQKVAVLRYRGNVQRMKATALLRWLLRGRERRSGRLLIKVLTSRYRKCSLVVDPALSITSQGGGRWGAGGRMGGREGGCPRPHDSHWVGLRPGGSGAVAAHATSGRCGEPPEACMITAVGIPHASVHIGGWPRGVSGRPAAGVDSRCGSRRGEAGGGGGGRGGTWTLPRPPWWAAVL